MKSIYLALKRKFDNDVEKLRKICKHRPDQITINVDHSVVGKGSIYPCLHVVCNNCGMKKVIFRDWNELKIKPKLTLDSQKEFKEERLNRAIQYDYEIKENI